MSPFFIVEITGFEFGNGESFRFYTLFDVRTIAPHMIVLTEYPQALLWIGDRRIFKGDLTHDGNLNDRKSIISQYTVKFA